MQTDASNDNTITGNDISHTTADQIEAKEGAINGTITNNTLDGTGWSPAGRLPDQHPDQRLDDVG